MDNGYPSGLCWDMALSSGLSISDRQQIQQWVAAHGTPQQVALRCRIVLAAADGQSDVAIAQQLSVNRKTVILWRQRFAEQRLDGLWEIVRDADANRTTTPIRSPPLWMQPCRPNPKE